MLPEDIRKVFDAGLPANIATSSKDGEPNATALSDIFWVDPEHIALSFQFFSKTIRNIKENPIATLLVTDYAQGDEWRLDVEFVREETEGAVFDEMDMRLQAIASMMGMQDVFKLRGAHIYKVHGVEKY